MTDNVFWPLQRPEDIPKNQTNWPTFAPPQWQTFTPPLTPIAVQAGRENSPYWAVTQTERELIQLVALIDRFRLGDPEVSAEDISDRYRSVKARLSTLNRQAYRDVLIRIAGADETVAKVKVFVEKVEPRIAAVQRLTFEDITGLREQFQALIPALHRLSGETMLFQEDEPVILRARLNNTYRNLVFFFIAFVVNAAFIGYLLFRERRRALESRANLTTAIDTMSDSFALYDAEDRLILSNKTFDQEMASLGDDLKAGMTYQQLLKKDCFLRSMGMLTIGFSAVCNKGQFLTVASNNR